MGKLVDCLEFMFLILVVAGLAAIFIYVSVLDFQQKHVWDPELGRYVKIDLALMRQLLRNAQRGQ